MLLSWYYAIITSLICETQTLLNLIDGESFAVIQICKIENIALFASTNFIATLLYPIAPINRSDFMSLSKTIMLHLG